MIGAFAWGTLAGASFVVGGFLALRYVFSPRVVGIVLGVGAGALVSAVSYELVEEAGRLADGSGRAAVGVTLGAMASYSVASSLSEELERPGLRLVLAAGLDVSYEAIVIVGSLLLGHGISAAAITAVFLCGVPEAMAWTGKLRAAGVRRRNIWTAWLTLMVLCGLVAGVTYALLDGADDSAVALVLAFAGGALLMTLMSDLVPTANTQAGALAGLATVFGFGLSFALIEFV